MNNGVNPNQQNGTNSSGLAPMVGVTVAPPNAAPVNASASAQAIQTRQQVPTVQDGQMPQASQVVQLNQAQPLPQTQQIGQQIQVQPQLPPSQIPSGQAPVAQALPQQPIYNTINTPNQLQNNNQTQDKKKKKKGKLTPILLFIILILGFYIVYSTKTHKEEIENMRYNCTPITASKEKVTLDLNSTLVQDLYSKVYTNIREDIAQPEFNDNMKIYLAYRQILETDKYDSNCNLFSNIAMEPYTCEVSTNFIPKAFKEEKMQQAIKKLFGEDTIIPFQNVRLGPTSCIGGYQYIAARGEFVEGYCNQKTATSYKVTKTLVEATSTRTTITLKEEVKYHENEKLSLPEYLKSGYYYYTFRLDLNYNYVFVSKTYESKY